MGLAMGFSSCSSSDTTPPKPPEPDPRRFYVEHVHDWGEYLVALVTYPGCTTYCGQKILVYRYTTIAQLERAKFLDPHFGEEPGQLYPIARFPPTTLGMKLAKRMCGR